MNTIYTKTPQSATAALGFLLAFLFPIGSLAAAPADLDVDDWEIKAAVENEFLYDRAVPYNDIDVETYSGVVTLDGKVYNLLAKERARQIAETVKGVRAVVNTIEVEPQRPFSSRDIRAGVIGALVGDPATDSYEIRVEARHDGAVTLGGTVDSWQEKNLCEAVAKGVKGVTAIVNNIEIDYESKRSDLEIGPEIGKRLRWDVLVDHALINVDVNNGNVTLSGTVGSAAEKSRARVDAWVPGVKSVDDSRLQVARWARDEDLRQNKYVVKSDDEIRQAVEAALLYDPRVWSFNVTAKVDGGVVTLEGVVDNLKAKHSATSDLRNTVGVVRVKNRLKVRPIEDLGDAEIAKNVRDALSRDAYVERYGMSVVVRNGIAHLYGTVDSFFEKGQAEDTTYRAKGVTGVRNHLRVDLAELTPHDPFVDPWHIYDYPWYKRDLAPIRPSMRDAEIKSDIEDELFWSPYVDSGDVAVAVEDGVATLTGTVGSWFEYHTAMENALEGGATQVINRLDVEE
jgi:osmotically-inducible protein OsmY